DAGCRCMPSSAPHFQFLSDFKRDLSRLVLAEHVSVLKKIGKIISRPSEFADRYVKEGESKALFDAMKFYAKIFVLSFSSADALPSQMSSRVISGSQPIQVLKLAFHIARGGFLTAYAIPPLHGLQMHPRKKFRISNYLPSHFETGAPVSNRDNRGSAIEVSV